QNKAYEIQVLLEFRLVLFRSVENPIWSGSAEPRFLACQELHPHRTGEGAVPLGVLQRVQYALFQRPEPDRILNYQLDYAGRAARSEERRVGQAAYRRSGRIGC